MEINNVNESKNIIEGIAEGSIAEELEIEAGDILYSINDVLVKDIIDYKYLISDDFINLKILSRNEELIEYEIEKDYDEDLGIIFTNPLIDRAKTCRNKCMFCFIDQLPPNMRDTLYFKDDDSRLSFLQGNFITLTNMSDDEIDRIIKYRLSPINVSVHTTNSELRVKMLNNKNAGKVYDILKRFHEANLQVNCQIVLIPNVNDGKELKKTIEDLLKLYPTIESLAIVPVGVTKYRKGLVELEPYNKKSASDLLDQVNLIQMSNLEEFNTRFVFPSDEFYCLSGRNLPSYEEYEDFPQLENGVGLMKLFEYEIEENLSKISSNEKIMRYTIATGTLANKFMEDIKFKIKDKFPNLDLNIIPIKNNFFGETITVSGLVTGSDIFNQLKDIDLGNGLLIPKSMLKANEDVFLDNISLDDLKRKLNIKVFPVEVNGKSLLNIFAREVK